MSRTPTGTRRRSGAIVLDGRDIAPLDEAGLAEIRGDVMSMIFQEPTASLNPLMTVGAQIVEALVTHRRQGRAVVQVDVRHVVVRVVVADAVDVVVLHEQRHRDADVGEHLPVRVVERAARRKVRTDLAVQRQELAHRGDRSAVAAALAVVTLAVGWLVFHRAEYQFAENA